MGAALAFLRALPSPDLLEGRTAAGWIRRVMGRQAYDVVWGPLLRAKFGAEAESIALPWFWARVHDRSAELGYIRGGFQQMYDRLAERIEAAGGKLAFSVEVSRIEPADDGIAVSVIDGDGPATHRYDVVLSTLPVRLLCRLTPALPDDYRSRFEWGRAFGAHCLILSLDRPLTSTYWLNINDPDFPFLALVEHTNYRDPAEYGGRHLMYLGNYRPMDDPLFTAGRAEVLATASAALTRINPAFDPSWIVEDWAFSAPFAQPIVTPEYRDHIPPFETPIPGLWSASMFQVYPHDRGQNYSIDLAERLLRTFDAASSA
jgi:protoporphyrinogen oxidase